MKKTIIICMMIALLSVLAFSGLVEEAAVKAKAAEEGIQNLNLKWTAGSNALFLEAFKGVDVPLEVFYSKLNGRNETPLNTKSARMNTTWDLMQSSWIYIEPEEITERSFYRLEPVRSQQYYGSCWAFSAIGAFESARAIQVLDKVEKGNVENLLDYSERWAGYHNVEIIDDTFQDIDKLNYGWEFFALYNAIRYGMIDEEAAPYSQIFISDKENIPLPTTAYGAVRTHSSKTIVIPEAGWNEGLSQQMGYTYEDYINMIKTAIKNYGSLAVSFSVPADFATYTHGIYSPTLRVSEGGHAVTLVGWAAVCDLDNITLSEKTNPESSPVLDEEMQAYTYYDPYAEATKTTDLCWIVKNSWDYGWGDGGYYVIPAISAEEYNSENAQLVSWWQIEWDRMFTPLFDAYGKHQGDELDINQDGIVNTDDFIALTQMLGTIDTSLGDLAYPRDRKVTNDDIATWVYLFQ